MVGRWAEPFMASPGPLMAWRGPLQALQRAPGLTQGRSVRAPLSLAVRQPWLGHAAVPVGLLQPTGWQGRLGHPGPRPTRSGLTCEVSPPLESPPPLLAQPNHPDALAPGGFGLGLTCMVKGCSPGPSSH